MLKWFKRLLKKEPAVVEEEAGQEAEAAVSEDTAAPEEVEAATSPAMTVADAPAEDTAEPVVDFFAGMEEVAEEETPAAAEIPAAGDEAAAVAEPVAEAETPPAATPAAEEKSGSLFQRLRQGLAKTRDSFVSQIDTLFLGRKEIGPELFDELEEILITADLGVDTTQDLLDEARKHVKRVQLNDPQALRRKICEIILSYLRTEGQNTPPAFPESGPFIIMVVGVNGVGKTTTIGKMASKFVRAGHKVSMVAADTFRAAAIEQLQIWGERIAVDVIARESGADPSSVVFDALDHAGPNKIDIVIIDTAGRLHTKVNLMEELKKIKRVIDKKVPGAPHEIMLVLDATTGQNAISQTQLFHEAVGVTGLTLTKLDGTAKGGILINLVRSFDIPIRFIGVGEQVPDLRDFEAEEFVKALFAEAGGNGVGP